MMAPIEFFLTAFGLIMEKVTSRFCLSLTLKKLLVADSATPGALPNERSVGFRIYAAIGLLLQASFQGSAQIGWTTRNGAAGSLERLELCLRRAFVARNNGAGMAHALSGGSGGPGDK